MNITSAKFIKGIIGTDGIMYNGKFQVAFIGRSNVGKSTLINSLAKKKKLARSSSSPGKTLRMDFFLINDKFYFVDLPGYGYAVHSMDKREKLAKMILWYLLYSEVKNRLVILIIDAKVGVTAYDQDMIKAMNEQHLPHIIVANKIDNIKKQDRERQLTYLRSEFKNSEVVPYSSKDKFGREKLLRKISEFMDK